MSVTFWWPVIFFVLYNLQCFINFTDGNKSQVSKEEKELRNMLDLLRINAETHLIHWNTQNNYDHDATPIAKEDLESNTESNEGECSKEKFNVTEEKVESKTKELDLKSASEMVRIRSSETAVTFLYLPKPPRLQDSKNKDSLKEEAEHYLTSLETLTNHWPPTLLVRGVSPVTSTTL